MKRRQVLRNSAIIASTTTIAFGFQFTHFFSKRTSNQSNYNSDLIADSKFPKELDQNWKFVPVTVNDSSSASNNRSLIQNQIDAVASSSTLGGGFVDLPAGDIYIDDALVLPSGIVLRGRGHFSTRLVKKNKDAPHWIVESENFDSLTGSGKWFVSEGIPTGFGLKDIALWGSANSPNSASDRGGVRFYGKRIMCQNIMIHGVDGVGFYSEGGASVGQSNFKDMPEGLIDQIWIRRCGNEGFLFRGPHDQRIGGIFVVGSRSNGVSFESKSNIYKGLADVDIIHSYANSGYGVYIDSPVHIGTCIGESNDDAGIVFGNNARNVKIEWLQAYNNNFKSGSYQVDINSNCDHVTIAHVQITPSNSDAAGGINNHGRYVNLDSIDIRGQPGSTGIGLYNTGRYCSFSGVINGFDGTGGIGFKTDGGSFGNYDLTIRNCRTVLETLNDYLNSSFIIRGYSPPQATLWSNPPQKFQRDLLDLDVSYKIGKSRYSSHAQLTDNGNTVDIGTIGQYTWRVPHGLFLAPEPEEVSLSVHFTGSNLDWRMEGPFVVSTDSKNVEVTAYVSSSINSPKKQPVLQAQVDI